MPAGRHPPVDRRPARLAGTRSNVRRSKTSGGGPRHRGRLDLLAGLLECSCGRRIRSDGRVGNKATFLELVRSGALSHDVMETHDLSVRVYGDTAVTLARGISGGKYQGQPFRDIERVSCVFLRQDGEWKCVLTHLSRLAGANG